MLKPLMEKYDSFVITEKTDYSAEAKGEKTYYMKQVNRREKDFIWRMVQNAWKSVGIYRKEKPDVVICTGVLAMIPICLISKFMLMVVSLILSWGSVAVLATLSRMVGKNIGISYFFVSDSNKVLALATGVSAFLFFKNIKIGYNKIINTIAASTFGVLLIHANSNTMRRWLWQDTFNNVGAYESGNVVIHAVVSVVLIYAVCTVIDLIRIRLVENPIMHQLDKINI